MHATFSIAFSESVSAPIRSTSSLHRKHLFPDIYFISPLKKKHLEIYGYELQLPHAMKRERESEIAC